MNIKINHIIARILGGKATSDDFLLFNNWLNEDTNNKKEFIQLKNYWDAEVSFNHSISPILSLEKTQNEILRKEKTTFLKKIFYIFTPIAAVVALVITVSVLYHKYNAPNERVEFFTYLTNEHKINFSLNDESEVTLNKNSRLTYSSRYGVKDRYVKLEGEGYFDIKHDPTTDFVIAIQADENVVFIKVLGTVFNVKVDEDNKQVIATLIEGSIQFESPEQKIRIRPNQELTYHYSTNDIHIKEVDTDEKTSWKDNLIKYKSIPLVELLARLEQNFNVRIIIQNKKLTNHDVTVTGSFGEEQSLDQILKVISRSIPFKWYVDNDGVYYIK